MGLIIPISFYWKSGKIIPKYKNLTNYGKSAKKKELSRGMGYNQIFSNGKEQERFKRLKFCDKTVILGENAV